jgi:hypothetical protein
MQGPGVELNGFRYVFLPFQSFEDGSNLLGVVCKRTYRIAHGERARADDAQQALFAGDVYWERSRPILSSVKHESDFVPCKPKTDVVVNARAYAPEGKPIEKMTVGVEVEGVVKKELLVVGDRHCVHQPGASPAFSFPLPFEEMPIRYEYAYGGVDPEASPEGGLPCPTNPVGVGFALAGPRSSQSVDSMPLPNIEDPKDRLTPERILILPDAVRDAPRPAGFGWYGKGWIPRILKAGIPKAHRPIWEHVHDLAAFEAKGAAIPSFDAEFWNGASPGLVLPALRGDEWMKLTGLDRAGLCRFQLPGEGVRVQLDLGEGLQDVAMKLTTVAVLREDDRLYQCWSGALPYESNEVLFENGFRKIVIEPIVTSGS